MVEQYPLRWSRLESRRSLEEAAAKLADAQDLKIPVIVTIVYPIPSSA